MTSNAKVSCRSPNDSETESPYSAVGSTDLLERKKE